MKNHNIIKIFVLLAVASHARAGTFADGVWVPANCGTAPAAPVVDDSSVKAYNDSLKDVKDWQRKAQAHNDCVVAEANADNEAIAKAANAEQERFRAAAADIGTAAAAAKARLDRK